MGGPSQNHLSGSAPDGQFAAPGCLAHRPAPLASLARSEWAAAVVPDLRRSPLIAALLIVRDQFKAVAGRRRTKHRSLPPQVRSLQRTLPRIRVPAFRQTPAAP